MTRADLISALVDCSAQIDEGDDTVEVLAASLRALMHYLGERTSGESAHALRPLAIIHAALHDLGRGAKPGLFFDYSHGKSVTRPTGTMHDYMRGHLAAALELLIRHGSMTGAEASAWLARRASVHGLRAREGHPLNAALIARWRNEANARHGPQVAREQFQTLTQRHRSSAFADPERARQRAEAIILNLATFAIPGIPPS